MKIEKNISLKKYTTIRIGGNAKVIYFPENTNDLKKLENIFIKNETLIMDFATNAFEKCKEYRIQRDICRLKLM